MSLKEFTSKKKEEGHAARVGGGGEREKEKKFTSSLFRGFCSDVLN